MTSARGWTKSLGRFCRSVDTTTQRPVMGSFLSSGIEGVLYDLYRGRAGVEVNRHDVEAARAVMKMMSHQIFFGQPYQLALLHRRDGFGRSPKLAIDARLDLDKHQRRAVARDDVQ